jgi:hypothetical protein
MKKMIHISLMLLLLVALSPLSASSVVEKDVGICSFATLQSEDVEMVYSADITYSTDSNIVEASLGVEKPNLAMNEKNYQVSLASSGIIYENDLTGLMPATMKNTQCKTPRKDVDPERSIAVEGPTRLDIGENFSRLGIQPDIV